MSQWLEVLRQKSLETSQAKVGAELRKYQRDGFPSGAVISQVLKGKYPGRTDRLQRLVEGRFMSGTVECPVVGKIPSDQCVQYQGQPFANTNPTRIALYRACRGGCEFSSIEG